jgi:hypothetical protein
MSASNAVWLAMKSARATNALRCSRNKGLIAPLFVPGRKIPRPLLALTPM